jgi:hypothetical protein
VIGGLGGVPNSASDQDPCAAIDASSFAESATFWVDFEMISQRETIIFDHGGRRLSECAARFAGAQRRREHRTSAASREDPLLQRGASWLYPST